MKPLTPERHSMRYVWNSVQCVSASSVLTEKASVCSPTPPAASGNSSPQNSCGHSEKRLSLAMKQATELRMEKGWHSEVARSKGKGAKAMR
eukprot:3151549-Pleurochrysis_carterae.AAC.3